MVANKYCAAVDTITGDQDMKLWKFELTTEEWEVSKQLERYAIDKWPIPLTHVFLDF